MVDENFKLFEDLIFRLHNISFYSLWDIRSPVHDQIDKGSWLSAGDLGLEGPLSEEWSAYVGKLVSGFIRLDEESEE